MKTKTSGRNWSRWWKRTAREEGRVCKLCNAPVPKSTWNDPQFEHLCDLCYQELVSIPHDPRWKLVR